MRVLCVTELFPNAAEPALAPFNRRQWAALGDLGHSIDVVAPVPSFPGAHWLLGRSRAARAAAVPDFEQAGALRVWHPRRAYVPRMPAIAAPLYSWSIGPVADALARSADVVLGAFAHPDGVAAALLARRTRKPLVLKVHGSDLHVAPRSRPIAAWIAWALGRADAVVAVSEPLARLAALHGAPRERISLVYDGVDASLFRPRSAKRERLRRGWPTERRYLGYVGRLERTKGVDDLLEAFEAVRAARDDVDLVLAGDGEARGRCEAHARNALGRVRVVGAIPADEVSAIYDAVDVVTLPSWSEGTPNTILEALASGRPVVASRVGGIPDVVRSDALGRLVEPRQPARLAEALLGALDRDWDADEIVATARIASWRESAQGLEAVLCSAIDSARSSQ